MFDTSETTIGEIVKWQRRSSLVTAFALVGAGVVLGAGGVFLKLKFESRFRAQSIAISELQNTVNKLKSDVNHLNQTVKEVVGGKNVQVQSNAVTSSSPQSKLFGGEDNSEEYTTADEGSDDEGSSEIPKKKRKITPVPDIASPSQGEGDGPSQLFEKVDKLLEGNITSQHEAFTVLKINKHKLQNSSEFWWRLAKATHYEANTAGANGDNKLKKEHFETAFRCAEKGLKLNENSADVHKWYAITTGALSEFASINDKIKSGYTFKEHVDRAISLNPNDSGCLYLLGRFCLEVSQLSWIERKVAATLFSNPPSSTPAEALQYFKKSENLKPFMENRYYMAKCYEALKDKKQALYWLDVAASMPIESASDKLTMNQIQKLRAKLR